MVVTAAVADRCAAAAGAMAARAQLISIVTGVASPPIAEIV